MIDARDRLQQGQNLEEAADALDAQRSDAAGRDDGVEAPDSAIYASAASGGTTDMGQGTSQSNTNAAALGVALLFFVQYQKAWDQAYGS